MKKITVSAFCVYSLLVAGLALHAQSNPTLPRVVASGRVPLAQASLALTTVYTTPAVTGGIYEVCAGAVVTTGGSTGATIQSFFEYFNENGTVKQPGIGASSALAATTAGVDTTSSGPANSSCQTVNTGPSSAIKVQFTIGGSPTTIPIYTYWWVVTRKR